MCHQNFLITPALALTKSEWSNSNWTHPVPRNIKEGCCDYSLMPSSSAELKVALKDQWEPGPLRAGKEEKGGHDSKTFMSCLPHLSRGKNQNYSDRLLVFSSLPLSMMISHWKYLMKSLRNNVPNSHPWLPFSPGKSKGFTLRIPVLTMTISRINALYGIMT